VCLAGEIDCSNLEVASAARTDLFRSRDEARSSGPCDPIAADWHLAITQRGLPLWQQVVLPLPQQLELRRQPEQVSRRILSKYLEVDAERSLDVIRFVQILERWRAGAAEQTMEQTIQD